MKKETKTKISHAISLTGRLLLGSIGVSGILITGALCPGLLRAVVGFRKKHPSHAALYQTIIRLDKKGWIVARRNPSGWKISATKRGKQELEEYELGHKHLQRPKKWDGCWHILSFDVPEKQKWRREKIRTILRTLGFTRLQDSIWVYPFECRNVLDLLRTRYGVRAEALYIRADHIDNDRWLKKEFDLK